MYMKIYIWKSIYENAICLDTCVQLGLIGHYCIKMAAV
jgi:hypothetical protein